MISLTELTAKLKSERKVALFCHVRPDGDSVGSAVALSLALKKAGVQALVFCSDIIPEKFCFLPSVDEILNDLNGEFSALVAVDCADINRLGKFADTFKAHKNTFNIDHHISNDRYAKYNYVFDNASNSENVLDICHSLAVEVDSDIANLLLTGILTDTGDFRHKNVTAQTLRNASELVEKGGDINYISYKMFTEQSKERAKLFAKVMSKIRYFKDGRIAVASVHGADILECNAKMDDTEGFIDFVMGITGVEIGACVLEIGKSKYKISFRSKSADVNAVAGVFGGGGHKFASGCQIFGEYEEVIDKITFAMGNYLID